MAKCPTGQHPDYDERFYRSCPGCPKVDSIPKTPPPRQTQESPGASASAPPPPPKQPPTRGPLPVTKLFWESAPPASQAPGAPREEIEPVAGWLVSVAGPLRGKAYPLFFGRNSVGRDASAVVYLSDQGVNREVMLSLTYDFRLNKYTVEPALNGRGIAHLDRRARYFYDPKTGNQLLNPDDLSPIDESIEMGLFELDKKTELTQEWNWYIHIGTSTLKFVPFFDRMTVWDHKSK